MKVYDIALAVIRLLVVFDLIREGATMVFVLYHLVIVLGMSAYPASYRIAELSGLASPVAQSAALLLILILSKPIARFAAKFASSQDAATVFH